MRYGMAFVCGCSLFCLISCSSQKNLVVLLPDPDGQVGGVVVSNHAGTSLLTESRHATEVKAATEAPSSPVPMKEEDVFKIFGEALSAWPDSPLRFLFYFESGTSELTVASRQQIPEILRAIEVRKSKDISIVGHTDRVGSRDSNYKLGLERTISIKATLSSRGVDPSGIEVTSHGEDNPLIGTPDEIAEPRNRRVEVTVR